MSFRREVAPQDAAAVEALVRATGVFSEAEVAVARELVEERLEGGAASGYEFLFVDDEVGLLGYACWGPIPCTSESHDLYWIAVRPERHGGGVGRGILAAAEDEIARAGGARIYVETSTRAAYDATRAFYERCGYARAATLDDFYAKGDGKAIYLKVVG
ncbi:MAG TPA: GNAT family N-acetyltransferase [Planctomycetota bacterium]|nr:GNAT family N-acetyltransferase [Planctomycetota bacterium]